MKHAAIPTNEKRRLQDLHSFNILDSDSEDDFNDLVELVSQICHCPIVSITFIDKDRQWFKATKNIHNKQGDRATSFCGHAILEEDIMVVADASKDERFADNPDVLGGLKVGFYAGAPITSSNGYTLGTVCAIDNNPRELTAEQLTSLKKIARQVSRLLDLKVRNQQVAETASLLLQAEKKMAQLNIKEREAENFKTAFLLHEEIAQIAAAVKLYVNAAKNTKELSDEFLDQSISELTNLTKSITGLSKSITPTTFEGDEYLGHIEKLLHDFILENSVPVEFSCDGDMRCLHGHFGLMAFRITQDLLKLAKYVRAGTVVFQLSSSDNLQFLFEYTGVENVSTNDKNMLQTNILNRVEMLDGTMDVQVGGGDAQQARIAIQLPFTLT